MMMQWNMIPESLRSVATQNKKNVLFCSYWQSIKTRGPMYTGRSVFPLLESNALRTCSEITNSLTYNTFKNVLFQIRSPNPNPEKSSKHYRSTANMQYFHTSVPLQPGAPGGPGGPCKPGTPYIKHNSHVWGSAGICMSVIHTLDLYTQQDNSLVSHDSQQTPLCLRVPVMTEAKIAFIFNIHVGVTDWKTNRHFFFLPDRLLVLLVHHAQCFPVIVGKLLINPYGMV